MMTIFKRNKKNIPGRENAKPWHNNVISQPEKDFESKPWGQFPSEVDKDNVITQEQEEEMPLVQKETKQRSLFGKITGSKYKRELENLRTTFTPEMKEAENALKLRDSALQELKELREEQDQIELRIKEKKAEFEQLKGDYIEMNEAVLLQSFGLYEPQYDFATLEEYKTRLNEVRTRQKDLIKQGNAVTGNMNWTVNNNCVQGKKLVKDMQKLLLRAFNNECDAAINKVKYNNYEQSKNRITKSEAAISKLGEIMNISITHDYFCSKLTELSLAFEYQQKKQQEKEEQAELRAQQREEAKLQKEIEAELKKLRKEKSHYKNALEKLEIQIEAAEEPSTELEEKKAELMNRLNDIDKAEKDVDYRAANLRAGYVYIISNIGSFGENVYKIGMTRRLDPNERVYELGDASVPFRFDVHAMIFSEDAPKLEAALHNAFADKKVNMVNQRREFFRVTLDEIKEVVKSNYEKTAEFIDLPDAEQYRVSEKMRAHMK